MGGGIERGGEQSDMDERFRRIEEEEEGSSLGMMSSMSHKTSRLVTWSGGKALFGGTEKKTDFKIRAL